MVVFKCLEKEEKKDSYRAQYKRLQCGKIVNEVQAWENE